jgi:hypothetical protein
VERALRKEDAVRRPNDRCPGVFFFEVRKVEDGRVLEEGVVADRSLRCASDGRGPAVPCLPGLAHQVATPVRSRTRLVGALDTLGEGHHRIEHE